jgi:hypothetical protein
MNAMPFGDKEKDPISFYRQKVRECEGERSVPGDIQRVR